MKKKTGIIILVFILIIISMAVIELLSNPLRKPEERIRADLLELIPLGTNLDDVISIVEHHESWRVFGRVHDDVGIIMGPRGPSIGIPLADEVVIGEKAISIHLGQYLAFFFIQTDVTVYMAFNENSELIEIAPFKSINVL